MQYQVAERADEFYGSKRAPTLATVKSAYGASVSETWLSLQIIDLAEFTGVRDKLSDAQIDGTAAIIATQFYFLTLAELMIFFANFKSGKYGRFFGTVDPMVITQALQGFVKERAVKIAKIERELSNKEREEADKSERITYAEYLVLKRKAASGDAEAIQKLQKK